MAPRAVIVGSGPSARAFDPPDDVIVIAVNGAVDWLKRVDYWFTLDPSRANTRRMNHKRPGITYCAALPPEYPEVDVVRYLRHSTRGSEPKHKGTPEWWLWRWGGVLGIAKDPDVINSGNSAWGALQLAYKIGARKVALIGVDASPQSRVEGGKPNNLSHLPLLFESGMDDMDITNCGRMKSRLPKMRLNEWL